MPAKKPTRSRTKRTSGGARRTAKSPRSAKSRKAARKPAKANAKKRASKSAKGVAKKPTRRAAGKPVKKAARKPARKSKVGARKPLLSPKAAKVAGRAKAAPKTRRRALPATPTRRKAVRRVLPAPRRTEPPVRARKAQRITANLQAAAAKRLVLVFVGPPGVGKGTQAAKLAAELGLPHISTGDLFRDHLKRETELGLKAREYMNAGALVPDDLVVALVVDRIAADDCRRGYILDGFPRTLPQAHQLADALASRNDAVTAVLYFDAPREVIVERISGRRTCRDCGAISHVKYSPTRTEGACDVCGGPTHQRADDEPEKVWQRLVVYDDSTGPLVPFYRSRGLLREFDARGAADEIYQEVRAVVAALA